MAAVSLDPQGRLVRFAAVPPQQDSTPASPQPYDWNALFTLAGLDMAQFHSAAPTWNSLGASDQRAAWTGVWPGTSIPLRVEAASWARQAGLLPVDQRLDQARPHARARGAAIQGPRNPARYLFPGAVRRSVVAGAPQLPASEERSARRIAPGPADLCPADAGVDLHRALRAQPGLVRALRTGRQRSGLPGSSLLYCLPGHRTVRPPPLAARHHLLVAADGWPHSRSPGRPRRSFWRHSWGLLVPDLRSPFHGDEAHWRRARLSLHRFPARSAAWSSAVVSRTRQAPSRRRWSSSS